MEQEIKNLINELDLKISYIERASSPCEFAQGRCTAFCEVRQKLYNILDKAV